MSDIYVCPLSALETSLHISGARRMITLAAPGKSIAVPTQITGGFLALEFNDIAEPREGLIAPDETHLHKLISFVEVWKGTKPLVIQCWMGVSRSTAAALIACAALEPAQDMRKLAKRLRMASPTATPNPLMIALADRQLGLDGRLIDAVRAIGRGADAFEGTPFKMDTSR